MGIQIEVAYATLERQEILAIEVEENTTALQAVQQSNIKDIFPEIDLDNLKLGIFSKAIKADQVVTAGDRIEIYRPLLADPKAMRKKRAEKAAAAKESKEDKSES